MKSRHFVLIIALFVFVVSSLACSHFFRDEVVGTVTEKVVKRYDKSDKYLIFVKKDNGATEVLENTDTLLEGKFNASDMYGSIKVGKKYRFKVYGWRSGCMSWYKNITKVQPL